MKAEIQDVVALCSISPSALRAFATFEGWKPGEKYGVTSLVYHRDGGTSSTEIILPITPEIGDYVTVVSKLIGIFSRELGRDELAIFKDLSQADRDVIRVRAADADDDGSIAIDHGVDLVSNARDMLASIACSAIEPRKTYRVGRMQQANSYMDRVRLGQTEIGSFIVTLLSPVPPSLDDSRASPMLWPEIETEPFERRVTRVLFDALEAAKSAIAAKNLGEGKSRFAAAVGSGVSANFCEALAKLCTAGDGSEITLSWAKTRPTPIPSKSTWFSTDDGSLLSEVAREFRLKEPRLETTLVGYIPNLRRPEKQERGTVKLLSIIDGHPASVSMDLEKEEYERAVEAHGRQFGISVMGDLVRDGQRWKLVGATDVRVIQSPADDDTSAIS